MCSFSPRMKARRPRGTNAIAVTAAIASLLSLVSLTSVAHADPASEALALKTFAEGRRHFEARRYDDALRAFQSSLDALPSPNTRLYLARCLREQGKIASAHSMFRVTSSEAEDRVRATGDKRYGATQRSAAVEAERLQPLVPHLTLRLEPAAGAKEADVARASVAVDGVAVSRGQLAAPLDLDPGPHTITVYGPHLKRTETPVTVAQSDAKTIAVAIERTPFGTLRVALKTKPAGVQSKPIERRAWRSSTASGRPQLLEL